MQNSTENKLEHQITAMVGKHLKDVVKLAGVLPALDTTLYPM
jgi:hypothetical protein